MVLDSSEVTLEGESNVRIASEHIRKVVLVRLREGQDNVLIQRHSVGQTYEEKKNHKQSNKISMIVNNHKQSLIKYTTASEINEGVDDEEEKPSSLLLDLSRTFCGCRPSLSFVTCRQQGCRTQK